jgi:hypothetical protein
MAMFDRSDSRVMTRETQQVSAGATFILGKLLLLIAP